MKRVRDYQVTVWYVGTEPTYHAIRNVEDSLGEWLEVGLGEHDGKAGWLNVRSNRTPIANAKYVVTMLGITATDISCAS